MNRGGKTGRLAFLSVLACVLAVAGPPTSRAAAAQSPERSRKILARFLADPAIRRATAGVHVVDLATGRVLAEANPRVPLIPASNMKILTVLAALEFLGPDHAFHTRLLAAGALEEGRLAGDLVLVGDGDPAFGLPGEDGADDWADVVRRRGIRTVAGDLVIVERGLDRTYAHADWIERYRAAENTALNVAALGLGENKVEIRVRGGARVGAPGRVRVVPDCGHVTIENRTRTVARGRAGPGSKRAWGSNTVTVNARVRVGKEIAGTAAVHDPPLFLARAFRAALQARGVTVEGRIRRAAVVPEAEVLATHRTEIDWMIEQALKKSDNRITEILYKTAGAAHARSAAPGAERGGDRLGTFAAGARAVAEIIRRARASASSNDGAPPVASGDGPREPIPGDREESAGGGTPGHEAADVLRDGSGLSRHNRLTAETMTTVLRWAFRRPHYVTFARALARGAESGSTLRRRFRETAVATHLRAKTGFLYHVRSLSGYVRVGRHRVLAFSVLLNDLSRTSPKARKALDWFVAALWRAARPRR